MQHYATGPPSFLEALFQLGDLVLVLSLAGLITWSVLIPLAGALSSSFRPPVPQREVIQVAYVRGDEDNRPQFSRLQL